MANGKPHFPPSGSLYVGASVHVYSYPLMLARVWRIIERDGVPVRVWLVVWPGDACEPEPRIVGGDHVWLSDNPKEPPELPEWAR
jgi:hypothetical protein